MERRDGRVWLPGATRQDQPRAVLGGGTTSAFSFSDSGLEAATAYFSAVVSTVHNRTSPDSGGQCHRASATTAPAPAAPSNLKANAGALE